MTDFRSLIARGFSPKSILRVKKTLLQKIQRGRLIKSSIFIICNSFPTGILGENKKDHSNEP